MVHRYVPLTDRYRITGRTHRPVGCLKIPDLQVNITKTTVLPKGVRQQDVFDVVYSVNPGHRNHEF